MWNHATTPATTMFQVMSVSAKDLKTGSFASDLAFGDCFIADFP